MAIALDYEVFAKQLKTKFRIRLNENQTLEAELTEISEHLVSPRQERFALVFQTSNETFLGQGLRPFEHDQMGNFQLFLVPIGRDEAATYYEAVFNRLVKKS